MKNCTLHRLFDARQAAAETALAAILHITNAFIYLRSTYIHPLTRQYAMKTKTYTARVQRTSCARRSPLTKIVPFRMEAES